MVKRAASPRAGATNDPDRGTLSAIGLLSLAHEVPAALGTIMVPTFFVKELGLPVERMGWFALPLVFTAFKWAWAPAIDRSCAVDPARRPRWIVAAALAAAFVYALLGSRPPSIERLPELVGWLGLAALVFSVFEIASDAFVLERLGRGARARGAGAVWLGKELGQVFGLAVVLSVADRWGWSAAFFCVTAVLPLLALPVLRVGGTENGAASTPSATPSLRRGVAHPFQRRLIAFTFVFAFVVQMPTAAIGPFLASRGLSLSEVGTTLGIAASVGAALSLAIATKWSGRLGVKRLALRALFVGLLALPAFCGLALVPTPSVSLVFAAIFWGALTTAPLRMTFYAARLEWTGARQAGTDFTLQQSAWFLGYAASLAVSGWLAATVGWFGFFALNGLATLSVMVLFVARFDAFEALATEAGVHAHEAGAEAEDRDPAPLPGTPPPDASHLPADPDFAG